MSAPAALSRRGARRAAQGAGAGLLVLLGAAVIGWGLSDGRATTPAPSVKPDIPPGAFREDAALVKLRAAAEFGLASPASPNPQVGDALSPAEAAAINASIPISRELNPPATPIRLSFASAPDRTRAVNCLAAAVYYEAASQSLEGRRAVAQVVLNRLALPMYPKTVCGVVFQEANLQTGCQFTFTCDGSLQRTPSAEGWRGAKQVAEAALDGYVEPSIGRATHYHTIWVAPPWAMQLRKINQIGAHIFYVWPAAGAPDWAHVGYGGREPNPLEFRLLDRRGPGEDGLVIATTEAVTTASPGADAAARVSGEPVRRQVAAITMPGAAVTSAQIDLSPAIEARAAADQRHSADVARITTSRLAVPRDW